MRQNYRAGPHRDRVPENLAGVNEDGVARAVADRHHADEPAAGVQQNHLEGLDGVGADVLAEQVGDFVGRVENRRFPEDFAGEPTG